MSANRTDTGRAPIRVLHVITDLRVGGAELQLARLIATAPSAGASVEVVGVVCLGVGGDVADALTARGVTVWRLGARSPVGLVAAGYRLGRILRAERVEVVIAWLYHAMIAAVLPFVVPSTCAVVWNVRGTVPTQRDKHSTRLAVLLSRYCAGLADRIIYNSRSARLEHEAIGFPRAVGSLIANGYETSPEVPTSSAGTGDGVPSLLLAARYHPMKDFGTFLLAVRKLRERGVKVRVRLVGEGCDPTNRGLLSLLESTGTAADVELGGIVRDMRPEYRRATVVCSASAWGEGFQNVLAEAALEGAMLVSTDVGDASELVSDARCLVAPGDPGALAAALEYAAFLSDSERRERAAAHRRRIGERYSARTMRDRYDALCVSVAGRST